MSNIYLTDRARFAAILADTLAGVQNSTQHCLPDGLIIVDRRAFDALCEDAARLVANVMGAR